MQDLTLSDGTTLEIKDEGRDGFAFFWRDADGNTLGEGDLFRGTFRLDGVISTEAQIKVIDAAEGTKHRVYIPKIG